MQLLSSLDIPYSDVYAITLLYPFCTKCLVVSLPPWSLQLVKDVELWQNTVHVLQSYLSTGTLEMVTWLRGLKPKISVNPSLVGQEFPLSLNFHVHGISCCMLLLVSTHFCSLFLSLSLSSSSVSHVLSRLWHSTAKWRTLTISNSKTLSSTATSLIQRSLWRWRYDQPQLSLLFCFFLLSGREGDFPCGPQRLCEIRVP